MTRPEERRDGAVALVTGGGRGIGRAIARALAGAGARVAVLGRGERELESAAEEIGALPLVADVTDAAAVAAAMGRVDAELGPLELLVANAGRFAAVGRSWELPLACWWRDVEVNLLGTHVCCREALRRMAECRRGRVVILTSAAGTRGPHVNGSAYGVSKLALAGYAETLAREAAGAGVCVFAIDPGPVRTAMTQPLLDRPELARFVPGFRASVEAGRDLPPEAAAELVLRLASGAADRLSGRLFRAGDDLAATLDRAEEILAEDLETVRWRRRGEGAG